MVVLWALSGKLGGDKTAQLLVRFSVFLGVGKEYGNQIY
jgi:hypothetical protein